MTTPRRITTLFTVAALSAAVAPAALGAGNPETAKLGPEAGAGKYLAGQDSPPLFHGCRKFDRAWYPTDLISDQPISQQTTERHVTFTVDAEATPTFSWEAKAGWQICGVVADVALAGPTTGGSELLAFITYKSGPQSGSTAPDGKETLLIKMPKNLGSGQQNLKVFAGQRLGIYGFQDVTV